jgi:CheY-like chemotaxis protein
MAATSAEAAVRNLTIDLLPCAVVTDLTLGGVEGWRLIRKLRRILSPDRFRSSS